MIWSVAIGFIIGLALWYAKAFTVRKDGGIESHVTGYWLFEVKWLCSVVLLRFGHGSRESFHSHAFDAVSWVFGPGELREYMIEGPVNEYRRSWRPVLTFRETFHRVFSYGTTWVLSFRGPWTRQWREYDPRTRRILTLEHGRRVVARSEPMALE